MYIIFIQNILEQQKQLNKSIENYKKLINKFPSGKLQCFKNGKHIKSYKVNGNLKKYIPTKESATIEKLALKKYYESCLDDCIKEKELLDRFIQDIQQLYGCEEEKSQWQIARMQQAGLVFNAHIMTGIAGRGRGMENAEKTAEFFNRTHPERITNFSLFLHRRAPLYQDYQTGRFVPASELDNLIEDRRLIELLDVPGLVYDGFHDMLKVRVRGTLPQDKEKMLKQFDEAIEKYRNEPPVYAVLGDEHEFSSNDVSTDRIA